MKRRVYRVPTTVAWAASGSISLELSPVPFTITGMMVVVHTDITTTTATNYNDYWDRVISRLSLTGLINNQNKTLFDFSNMRMAYHDSRFVLKQFAPRRATVVADSATNNLKQFTYYFHFGVNPIINGQFNWRDLTGGIPKVEKGQLTLGGTFGTAAAPGTNVTVNATSSCFIEVYLVGWQAEDGEDPMKIMPQAFPLWSMRTPTPTATSTMFSTSDNVPAGAFLRAMTLMLTNGTNAPRDDQVLNSLRLYDQYGNKEILTYGGRAGASDAGGGDYKAAEFFSQMELAGSPQNQDMGGTAGVPALTDVVDTEGLVHLLLVNETDRVHPLYGADLRMLSTGDLRLDYGVADATGIAMDVLYKRYELNPMHPANAAYL